MPFINKDVSVFSMFLETIMFNSQLTTSDIVHVIHSTLILFLECEPNAILIIYLFIYLATLCSLKDLSSITRAGTSALDSEKAES